MAVRINWSNTDKNPGIENTSNKLAIPGTNVSKERKALCCCYRWAMGAF